MNNGNNDINRRRRARIVTRPDRTTRKRARERGRKREGEGEGEGELPESELCSRIGRLGRGRYCANSKRPGPILLRRDRTDSVGHLRFAKRPRPILPP
jgi:hypothetical protein